MERIGQPCTGSADATAKRVVRKKRIALDRNLIISWDNLVIFSCVLFLSGTRMLEKKREDLSCFKAENGFGGFSAFYSGKRGSDGSTVRAISNEMHFLAGWILTTQTQITHNTDPPSTC